MNETRAQRMLRQLNSCGASVTKSGAVYEIRFKDELVRTTDLTTLTQGDMAMLTGQPMLSRAGSRKASGRDW